MRMGLHFGKPSGGIAQAVVGALEGIEMAGART
jgi:hypothetical protein